MIIKYSTHKNIFRSWLNRKTGNKYSFFVRNEKLFLSVVHEPTHTIIKSIIVLIDDKIFAHEYENRNVELPRYILLSV